MANLETIYLMGGIADGRLGEIAQHLQTFIISLPSGRNSKYKRTRVQVYTLGKRATVFKLISQETQNGKTNQQ